MMETADTLLRFWFGAHADDAVTASECSRLWWSKHPETDQEIRVRFEPLLQQAAAGRLADWGATVRGRLALVLLTDQFPRNMYRGSPRSFAFDELARGWTLSGLEGKLDQQLRPIERVFFYMPLEHSESREHQALAVSLFGRLVEQAPAAQTEVFRGFLDFAVRHRDIIERFGRFPHRNALLGRRNTAEETAFLLEPGSSF